MSFITTRRWVFGRRARPAVLSALALAASLLLAAHFREAQSRQVSPDLAADALPHLNLIARHAAQAAEYAKQVKARYPPTSTEYLDARNRYEAAAEKFDALLEALAASVRENSDAHSSAQLKEKARLAVEAGDSFADWAEGGLQLMGRARGAQGRSTPPQAAEVVEAAGRLTDSYGRRDEGARTRAVELMKEMAEFKPWDEIPPVTPPVAEASATPASSPTPNRP
jgi:hypothetical protein